VRAQTDFSQATSTFLGKKKALKPYESVLHGETNFGVIEFTPVETPLQKFRRIQLEIEQLAGELQGQERLVGEQVSSKDLIQQVKGLQQQLVQIGKVSQAGQPQEKTNELISQIKDSSKLAGSKDATREVAESTRKETESTRKSDQPNLAQLDSRLVLLEKVVGVSNQEQLHFIEGNLSKSILTLEEKIKILTSEPAKVESTLKKLKASEVEAERISSTAASTASPNDAKVNALYEKMEKWDQVVETLPTLVERLKALRQLHQEAALFSQTLQQITNDQTVISSNLRNHEHLLKQVEENFVQNNEAVQANIENLDKRMNEVLKKMEALNKK